MDAETHSQIKVCRTQSRTLNDFLNIKVEKICVKLVSQFDRFDKRWNTFMKVFQPESPTQNDFQNNVEKYFRQTN